MTASSQSHGSRDDRPGWEPHGAVRRSSDVIAQVDTDKPAPPLGLEPRGQVEQSFPLSVVASRLVDPAAKERGRELMLRVARMAPRPVLRGRLVLRWNLDPALERRAAAKGSLDVSGRQVRAHAEARSMGAAVDLLEARLRRNLETVEDLRRAHRRDEFAAE